MKTSMVGLGAIVALVVAWRALLGVFGIAILLFKILVFFVLPACFMIWLVYRFLRVERKDTTAV